MSGLRVLELGPRARRLNALSGLRTPSTVVIFCWSSTDFYWRTFDELASRELLHAIWLALHILRLTPAAIDILRKAVPAMQTLELRLRKLSVQVAHLVDVAHEPCAVPVLSGHGGSADHDVLQSTMVEQTERL